MLTGLAFAAPITAFAAGQKNDSVFSMIFRFFITPLFLFSGTFFPIEQLPLIIRPIAWLTPTFHGVALARGLSLGNLDPVGAVVHLGVLRPVHRGRRGLCPDHVPPLAVEVGR